MRRFVIILAMTSLGLVSCQSSGARPTPQRPAGPTETPSGEPTATPTNSHPPPTVPPDFRNYEDRQAGFTISYPADWTVAGQAPGSSLVVQSFEPAMAGAGGIPQGETKCDVIVRQDVDSVGQAIEQVQADESLEILAQFNEVQVNGTRSIRMDIASERTGEYGQVLLDIEGQVISVSCLGAQFDVDAITTSLQPLP